MRIRVWILVVMATLLLPSLANAAVCNAFYPVVADGRLYDNAYFVPASQTYAVFSFVTPGHSYSVEVTDPFDNVGGPGTFFFSLQTGGGDCVSNTTDNPGTFTGFADSGAFEPRLYGGRRISFQLPSSIPSNTLIYAIINNTDTASGHSYRVQIVDTTLFSPGWSTFGNSNTYWSFTNTSTTQTIVVFQLFNTKGVSVSAVSTVIPAGNTYSTNTFDLGTPRTMNGWAVLTSDSPPGTLIATAAIYSGGANPQVVPFVPRSK